MPIKVKHPTYEVITPVFGKKVLVRGLTFKEEIALRESVTMYNKQASYLYLHAIYNCIENKEVYKNDFEYFLTHTIDDDLAAIVLGIAILTVPEKKLSFSVTCPNCKKENTYSIPFENLITDIKVNQNNEPIFDAKSVISLPERDIEISVSFPNYKKAIIINDIIGTLSSDKSLWPKYNITEINLPLITTALLQCLIIDGVKQISTGESVTISWNQEDPNFLDTIMELVKVIAEFDAEILEKVNSWAPLNKYYLKMEFKANCKNCNHALQGDLKSTVINLFRPGS